MATLSSPGLGSGLDVSGLISKLMTVEQRPVILLNQKEAAFQAKISALGSLKGTLSTLQTAAETLIPGATTTAAEKYTSTTVSVADNKVASATTTNAARAGTYTLSDIITAKAQQIYKTGLGDTTSAGTLSITVGTGTAVSVDIASGTSVSGVRDAINASTAGVTASIINNGTSDVLVLTAKDTGVANKITITGAQNGGGSDFDAFNYSSTDANTWELQQDATSASVKINGIPVESPTNSITSAVEGLTLNLIKDGADPTTLTISKSNGAVSNSLSAFIKAYNDAVGVMKNLGNYDAENKKASSLTGDATLRSAQAQLRSALFAPNGGSNPNLQRLSDLGVSVQTDGTLKLDSTKLTNAITADFDGVASLVADIGTRFKTTASGLVADGGSVSSRIDGINASIKEIGQRRDAWGLRLEKIEANYRRQYTALDVQISNMQSLSASLAQQLAGLASLNNR